MVRDVDPKLARLYDKRTVDRNIKKGLLTRKDYEKHLKSLEDVADKGAFGAVENDSDDDLDDDIDDEEDEVAAEAEADAPTPSDPQA
jgi:RNA-splicing ligase RtcB